MTFTRKDSLKLIKSEFLPLLKAIGFKRLKSGRGGYRIRDGLVDVISIQVGRNPGAYYMHYFPNYLCNKFSNIVSSNIWGRRLSRAEGGDAWFCESIDEAIVTLHEVGLTAQRKCLPELDQIKNSNDLKDMFEEAMENKPRSTSRVLAYAVCGLYEEAKQLSGKVYSELEDDECFEPDKDDDDKQYLNDFNSLVAALDARTVEELLASWRSENLIKYSLVE